MGQSLGWLRIKPEVSSSQAVLAEAREEAPPTWAPATPPPSLVPSLVVYFFNSSKFSFYSVNEFFIKKKNVLNALPVQ